MTVFDKNYPITHYPIPKVKEVFIDITHNTLGVLCRMLYNPETKSYRFEPIDKGRSK